MGYFPRSLVKDRTQSQQILEARTILAVVGGNDPNGLLFFKESLDGISKT